MSHQKKRRVAVHSALWLWIAGGILYPGPALAADAVAYRLKWLINMSTVGDIYTQEHGFFKSHGLRVEIKPGGPEHDAIREVELGRTEFGVASADQIIRAVEKGAPLVVVAQLFQTNPLHWIYRPDRITIEKPTDLKGRTLGVTFGKNDEIIMRTLLNQAGIGEEQVNLFGVRLDFTPFYQGKVDLWPVYINSQGVEIGARMERSGEKVAFFNPERFGVRFVANSVVTSEKLLKAKPQLVKRFLQALLKGWHEALDPINAAAAVALVRRYDPDTTEPLLQDQLLATRPLMRSADGNVGRMDVDAWAQTEKILLTYKQIAAPVNITTRLRQIID
jgi:NitT/TauT family transport system substrate-binding protein